MRGEGTTISSRCEEDNVCSLNCRQLVDATTRTAEHRQRRRERGRRSGCCSCMGRMTLLLIVTVDAHDAVFVLCILVFVADGALKLQSASLISSDQAQRHTSTVACERGTISDACAVVVQWSMRRLTFVELDMLAAADRQQSASLHHAEQQQSMSAHVMAHAMHTSQVHVAV